MSVHLSKRKGENNSSLNQGEGSMKLKKYRSAWEVVAGRFLFSFLFSFLLSFLAVKSFMNLSKMLVSYVSINLSSAYVCMAKKSLD